MKRMAVGVVAVAFAWSGVAEAAPDSVALGPGQKVVRTGHLEGASVPGVILAPYRSDTTEQLCTPAACDEVRVTVKLPRDRINGELAAAVTAPMQSAGLNMRVFDATGALIASAQGGGFGTPDSDVSSYVIARDIKPGTYTVRTYLSAGVADFKQTLTWKAGRARSAR
jgi:hypothetical protein